MPSASLTALETILTSLYPCNRPSNWVQIINTPSLEDLRTLIFAQFNHNVSPTVFGSASTGLVGEHSDIDINLASSDTVDPRRLICWLATRCDYLGRFFVENYTLNARVPIVRLRDCHTGRVLDVSVSNYLPEVNSKLVAAYVGISPKVRRFIMAIIVG